MFKGFEDECFHSVSFDSFPHLAAKNAAPREKHYFFSKVHTAAIIKMFKSLKFQLYALLFVCFTIKKDSYSLPFTLFYTAITHPAAAFWFQVPVSLLRSSCAVSENRASRAIGDSIQQYVLGEGSSY